MEQDWGELDALLMDWESGDLDAEGLERLRESLRADPAARSRFLEQQMLTAAIFPEGGIGLSAPPAESSPVNRAARPSRNQAGRRMLSSPAFWLASGASLMIGFLASGWIEPLTRRPPESHQIAKQSAPRHNGPQEAMARGVAMLTRLVDVRWDEGGAPLEAGQSLPPGRFAIAGGLAQLEFLCGATLVLEGPAELELVSSVSAIVRGGRLRANVPPAARGFSLQVADLRVVDLGTEFGVSISADGASVEVFDGEVELHPASNVAQLLRAGEAVTRSADGQLAHRGAAPEPFLGIADLESLARRQGLASFHRWRDWSESLRRDSRLIAYYAFDQPGDWSRRLTSCLAPARAELDGAIVGAREVPGRWEDKRALEFKQPADRVRVQIPGEFGSLTFACWVKIDSLDRWYNSLFLTDGYDKGEPHWQILDSGQLYFSVRPAAPGKTAVRDFKALSPPFWRPALNGRWIHLAVTLDLESAEIVHYLDGEPLSRHSVPRAQLPATTQVGAASIGNWAVPTLPDAEFAVRNLNGSMDEFLIFASALSPEEIADIYREGKP